MPWCWYKYCRPNFFHFSNLAFVSGHFDDSPVASIHPSQDIHDSDIGIPPGRLRRCHHRHRHRHFSDHTHHCLSLSLKSLPLTAAPFRRHFRLHPGLCYCRRMTACICCRFRLIVLVHQRIRLHSCSIPRHCHARAVIQSRDRREHAFRVTDPRLLHTMYNILLAGGM